jgi:hypothetical protein
MRAMLRVAACAVVFPLMLGCSSSGGSPGRNGVAGGGAAGAGNAGAGAAAGGGASGGGAAGAGGAAGRAGSVGAAGSAGSGGATAGAGGATAGAGGGAGASSHSGAGASGVADGAAGASGGCGPGTVLCEDFEAYATPADLAAAWTPTMTAATLTVDATKASHGTRALHIKAAAGTPVAVIAKQDAPLFPIAGNVIFGRVMMWLTATPGGDYHWNNIQAAGDMPGSTMWGKYGWGGQFGKVLAGYTVRTAQTAMTATIDCSNPSASAFPSQRWVCVEWEFDGTKNEMHLWFDGTLLSDVDVVGMGTRCVNNADLGKPWSAPSFSFLSLGWQQYQASNGPLELWMDDVAVGTQRVGCPAH